MKSPVPNLGCTTIPAQASIPLGHICGAVLNQFFFTSSAVQRGGYCVQPRVGYKGQPPATLDFIGVPCGHIA